MPSDTFPFLGPLVKGTLMHVRPLRVAAVAATTMAIVATAIPADGQGSTAVSPHYGARAASAAHWQASQVAKGRIRISAFDDWGLTIDSSFAFAADGTRLRALRRVTTAIENNYYSHYAVFQGDKFAGAMSKSLLAAKVLGKRPRHFGGHNVRRQVLRLVAPRQAGFESGRVRDTGSTDFTNTFSQSYAVLGLARTGGVPQRAVDYLLKQQCTRGYFRTFETVGQTCNASSSRPDVDATGLAVQALLAARRSGARIGSNAITRAATWLAAVQNPNGSFGGGSATSGANTNSTGIAAQALFATHHRQARRMAARYVAKLQITRARADSGPARRDIGAIAYNRAALSAALRDGVTGSTRGQFRRSTPQAIYAFEPKPLNTLSVP